jgi:cytoskeletal protein RodZ
MDPSKSHPPPTHIAGIDRAQARRLGRERVARRREHISRIRKHVVAASATAFLIAWAAIFFQLASGHDPALSKSAQASTVSSTASSTDNSSSTSSDNSSSTSSDSTPSSGSDYSYSAAPVTTQQS